MEEASWRRDLGAILEASGGIWEASGRHLEASGRHLGGIWRHLGDIWRSEAAWRQNGGKTLIIAERGSFFTKLLSKRDERG